MTDLLCRQKSGAGYASLEMYIMSKETLLGIMDCGASCMKNRINGSELSEFLISGGKIAVYVHQGYAQHISSVRGYYEASMDMLNAKNRAELFPESRPVRTKGRSDVSTYYGEEASSKNCLVADGCFIEGSIENCIIFRDVRVGKGACIKNSVIMQDTVIGEGAELNCLISDKDAVISPYITLSGSPRLPLVIPKLGRI
ncbi:MAG: hypothetical protein EOM14_14600 [Clostridia bacterium]|nr:hypothetical protein [Clostridia bacterium]